LKKAIADFTAAPSADLHSKAKQAWVAARPPYLQSEVFRISAENADFLDSAPGDFLNSPDEKAGGFRAVEFLLWGEDGSVDGAGARSHEDFIKEKSADAPRRAEYLNASAALVAGTLAAFAEDWTASKADNARGQFVALSSGDALKEIHGSITKLTGDELGKKRVGIPYESRDQKDESSKFSDTTHLDLIYSCSGIANVVAGAYIGLDKQVEVQGAGLQQLATALDAKYGESLKLSINRLMLAVTDFRPPFDRALAAPDDSPAREAIKEILDALTEMEETTAALAKALGVE
jgi:putative iron-regulated protein